MGDTNNNIVNHQLPPGFRFYPTDEELLLHFLHRKAAALLPSHPDVIPDLHPSSYDPWELHGRALEEGKQWYYYSRRTQSRVTNNGYWKPTGMEESVVSTTKKNKRVIGIKKHFVFHVGEAPAAAGIRTNWIMQEYNLLSLSASSATSSNRKPITDYSKWVICRVYDRNGDYDDDDDDGTDQLSCLDEVFLSLDDLIDEISLPN